MISTYAVPMNLANLLDDNLKKAGISPKTVPNTTEMTANNRVINSPLNNMDI